MASDWSTLTLDRCGVRDAGNFFCSGVSKEGKQMVLTIAFLPRAVRAKARAAFFMRVAGA